MSRLAELFEIFKDVDDSGPICGRMPGDDPSLYPPPMAAKLVPEEKIIEYLEHSEVPVNKEQIFELLSEYPKKVVLAKLRAMIRKGKINGCCCGCDGDFTLI